MEFAAEDFSLVAQRKYHIDGVAFFHDFVVTKNYIIFNQPPIELDVMSFVLGSKCAAESISLNQNRKSKLHVIPRDPSNPVVRVVELDAHLVYHYSNAFEEEDGSIVFDGFVHDRLVATLPTKPGETVLTGLTYEDDVTFSQLTRCRLTPTVGDSFKFSSKPISKRSMDFPTIPPSLVGRPYRYLYAAGAKLQRETLPYQCFVKVDTVTEEEEVWLPKSEEFIGEPCFIPRKKAAGEQGAAEDFGYVLTLLNDGRAMTTELLLFDAQKIASGPIHRTKLPLFVPAGLHGSYVDGLAFEPEDVLRRFTAVKALDSRNWNEMTGGFSGLGIKYEV